MSKIFTSLSSFENSQFVGQNVTIRFLCQIECWWFIRVSNHVGDLWNRCSFCQVFINTGTGKKEHLFYCNITGIGWAVLDEKVALTGDCFFFQDHLLEIRAYWLPLKCSRAKLWKSKLPRILNYLIKHHNLPSHCKYQPVTLLRIKKTIIILPKSKEIAQSNISISQSFIFTRIPNFVRVHWVCLLI